MKKKIAVVCSVLLALSIGFISVQAANLEKEPTSAAVSTEKDGTMLKAWVRAHTETVPHMNEDGSIQEIFRLDMYSQVFSFKSASETMNLYAKATLANDNTGYVYDTTQQTNHYVTETRSPYIHYSFPADRYDPYVPLQLISFGAIRLTNNTTDNDTQSMYTAVNSPYPMSAISADETQEVKPFDFGKDMEVELQQLSYEKVGIDIENYQYLSMSDALTDSNYKNTVPAQILTTIFMELGKGEYLPYGIFNNDDTAYVFQRTGEDSHKLVEYSILTGAPESYASNSLEAEVDNDSMYASVPYEITNVFEW